MRIKLCIAAVTSVLALPGVASAHNLGHVFLPDGTCLEVGSAREAPLVGQDRTQLDLVPGTANPPRDEYGTSFVGYWGNTPILPGRCPVVAATASSVPASLSSTSSSTTVAAKPSSSVPGSSFGLVGPFMSLGPRKER
jgi:hypothetical protein